MNVEANGSVNYSVKELLAKIEGKLDGVIITIGQKADKHDVERLRIDVDGLIADKTAAGAILNDRRWLLRTALTLMTVAIAACGVLVTLLLNH
jgi:hypothetical protein